MPYVVVYVILGINPSILYAKIELLFKNIKPWIIVIIFLILRVRIV